MCGICGSLSFGSLCNRDIHAIIGLMKLMERRGPDDKGFWTDRAYSVLGFRRLAILDLSPTGRQPMITADGRYAIVYNGEVYNFKELREELRWQGIQFRSTGDTEVVLYALALWGKAALHRFNGMFALALYDTIEKRLLLARDHAGIKPIYYLLSSDGLVFASQYDQIMAHPWAERAQLRPEGVALYLRFGFIPAPYALLAGTYMLEPGTWLEVAHTGEVKRDKFFEFHSYQEPDLHGQDAYEVVDEVITQAVRRHLVSDVPIGTFLSGGIDSPLVTAKAMSLSKDSFRAFTVGTNGDDYDESPDAAAYAREIGVNHVVEQVTSESSLQMLDNVVSSCGEPFADYSIFPTMMIAQMARPYAKVILSGDGGDELFWGYPRFNPVLKRARDFTDPSWLRWAFWRLMRSFGRGAAELGLQDIGDRYQANHTRIHEGDLRSIFPDVPGLPVDFDLFTYSGSEPNQIAQWMRWSEFVGHLPMVLLKVDRASMHHSVEVRVPLLDREVINVASRIDWRSCLDLDHDLGKLPLRRSLSRHVQFQVKTKRGFEVPMNAWLRGPLKAIFQECVLARKEILGIPVNQKKLRSMFQQHINNETDHARCLWTLLSLALWEQRHYRVRLRSSESAAI